MSRITQNWPSNIPRKLLKSSALRPCYHDHEIPHFPRGHEAEKQCLYCQGSSTRLFPLNYLCCVEEKSVYEPLCLAFQIIKEVKEYRKRRAASVKKNQ